MGRSSLLNLIATSIFLLCVGLFLGYIDQPALPSNAQFTTSVPASLPSAVTMVFSTSTLTGTSPSSIAVSTTSIIATRSTSAQKRKITSTERSVSTTSNNEISRIQDPYPTPPDSFASVNTDARSAVVNILCEPNGATSLNPISGSGVLIDPRGIILTNAHVAQYVLLSESPQVNLRCYVRTGSPATIIWNVSVLYIPTVWVDQHFSEINQDHPAGTGEHDYALLYITSAVNGTPLPTQFPYLSFDKRPAIGFPGDQVLVASYPAEMVGGLQAVYGLYADTSVTTIKQLLTFGSGTPDVLSLGGVIEAQGGSSGGAIVNQWGKLIALIATTSGGTTTSDRDLRGITLSYINTDILTQEGMDLGSLLDGDPTQETQQFSVNTAPSLIQLYVAKLSSQEQ